jgi:hypothetical protein
MAINLPYRPDRVWISTPLIGRKYRLVDGRIGFVSSISPDTGIAYLTANGQQVALVHQDDLVKLPEVR